MEHLGEELDDGRLVRVLLGELHSELEGAVLERGVVGAEDDGVPHHDVVLAWRSRHAGRRILLQREKKGKETTVTINSMGSYFSLYFLIYKNDPKWGVWGGEGWGGGHTRSLFCNEENEVQIIPSE